MLGLFATPMEQSSVMNNPRALATPPMLRNYANSKTNSHPINVRKVCQFGDDSLVCNISDVDNDLGIGKIL